MAGTAVGIDRALHIIGHTVLHLPNSSPSMPILVRASVVFHTYRTCAPSQSRRDGEAGWLSDNALDNARV